MIATKLFKSVAKLGGLRLITLTLMLIHSVLIVRFMSLVDIGWYYLIATIAYLGNGAIFVGADFYLQRQLANLSINKSINCEALVKYVLSTSIAGGAVVTVASTLYFSVNDSENLMLSVIVCTGLSIGTYLSTLGRNLCQIASLPVLSNLGSISEGMFKVIGLLILGVIGNAQPLIVAALVALSALISAVITFSLLLREMHIQPREKGSKGKKNSYLHNKRHFSETVLSVGASGVLNWAQLQGYRPLLIGQNNEDGSVVGTVSFMSTLGSTAASAVFAILAQFQVPLQYTSTGTTTVKYLKLVALLAVVLSLAALPASAAFLWITEKWNLLSVVYLVVVGVIIESGNATVGVCTHHMNAQKKTLWGVSLAGLAGCIATFIILLIPMHIDMHTRVALALVVGQGLSVVMVLYFTFGWKRGGMC